MDNDDRQIGHILSRREVLALFGGAGAALLAACAPGETATAPPAVATTAASPAGVPTAAASAASVSQPTSTAPLNAEAATATVLRSNPTAAASQQGQVATAAAANTHVATAPAAPGTVALPACIVRPEVTEGPYYVAEDLDRSDVRADPVTGAISEGALLTLTFNVASVARGGCAPLQGAKVEIWHCDAAGVYSDVADPGFSTKGKRFLRGYQRTDANGRATFTTIYPGWYRGRAVHIHFKVGSSGKVFTSQLFFDDALSDQVFAQPPYAVHGKRDRLNRNDGIYKDELLLATTRMGQGYAGSFDIGLQL